MKQSDGLLWPAPAKLNLFLHITGRRPDGYHTLQTAFQFIDLFDQLRLTTRADGRIQCRHRHPDIPRQRDLTIKAAHLLQQHTGTRQGADIELIKRLPTGAGIGGGSSDAATVLTILNRLWKTGLTDRQLAELGVQLGADVPVFIYGQACWAEGIGEILTPIDLPEPVYLLICPPVSVSTAQIFSSEQLTRNTPPVTIADFLAGQVRNDCEAVVRRQVPAVDEAMQWLARYGQARLTGTGACIFAEFASAQAAGDVAARCPRGWQSHICRGHNRSPLHRMLSRTKIEQGMEILPETGFR